MKFLKIQILVLFYFFSIMLTYTWARSHRLNQLPNFFLYGCNGCHDAYPPVNNLFGIDAWNTLSGGNVNWDRLYSLDSDGDGYSNGQELGDPHGRWTGQGSTQWTIVTDPSDGTDFPQGCGDGTIGPTEECEGANLNGRSCITEGYLEGELSCSASCIFDFSSCSRCGNAVKDREELCDGGDLGGQSCATLGFYDGTVTCTDQCEFDTSNCTLCGNRILDEEERCDQNNLNNQSCLTLGYARGRLVCNDQCDFDESDCDYCGNGVLDPGEECDRTELNGETCLSLDSQFLDGNLSCTPNCTFTVAQCLTCLDRDDDLVCDDQDNCPDVYNPDQQDIDQDTLGNACDPVNDLAPQDRDGDGIDDEQDNCATIDNPDQSDLDQDGQGDLCDSDQDGDGIDNLLDNCPDLSNSDQSDMDQNGQGDVCDENNMGLIDSDGDGVAQNEDNCPQSPNPQQTDLDMDGIGDQCDADQDGDGVDNLLDNCVDVINPDQADENRNRIGDACEDLPDEGGMEMNNIPDTMTSDMGNVTMNQENETQNDSSPEMGGLELTTPPNQSNETMTAVIKDGGGCQQTTLPLPFTYLVLSYLVGLLFLKRHIKIKQV